MRSPRLSDETLAWAAERVAAHTRGRVLDVGCGDGRFLPVGGIGVDRDAARLVEARSRSDRLVRADAHALPFRDATVDTVYAHRMLNAAGRIDGVLAEVGRVLAPNGRLLVLTGARHDETAPDRLDRRNGEARLLHHFELVTVETPGADDGAALFIAERPRRRSLWHHADFLRLWAGQTVSRVGSVVTRTAVPLVALLTLGAGPRELAALVIVTSAGVLLVGLFAGAWVDRLRRRPLLIWNDVARAALLLWIPVAFVLGVLAMEQLYVVMFLHAALGALFDAAYPAYVPTLIGTDRLVEGNGKLAMSSSIAEVGGPSFAGTLVQAIGAPFAMLVDASSFLVSAASLALIRSPEPLPPPREVTSRITREIVEGLRIVRRNAVVFAIAARSVPDHFFGAFYAVLYSLYLLRELHLDPFLLGVVISAGGVSSLVGSVFASRVIGALGIGPTMIWMTILASTIGILTPLAQGPLFLATLMVFVPQLIGDGLKTIEGVAEISTVQGVVSDRVRGRVSATLDVVAHGAAYPLGAVAAAVIAELIGARGAIAIGWAGMAASVVFLILSPIPRLRSAADYVAAPPRS